MQLDELKTLTGLTLKELAVKLDEELPADAYSGVPGGADLTDIDPGYMRKVLTQVFGICGIGWGYQYDVADLGYEPSKRGTSAVLRRLEFWYVLVDQGNQTRVVIPASGGSDNSNAAYALKGAITNALGNAVSNLGFQESVYLGHRSHRTVGGGKKAPVGNGNGNGHGKTVATPAIQACSIHQVPMRQYPRKDGKGTYFAHQNAGKWCYGKTAEPKLMQAADAAVKAALG